MQGTIRLLIRADAGPKIGTGHVMRCLALGQAWKALGGPVDFVCGQLPARLRNQIEAENFGLYRIGGTAGDQTDAKNTSEIIRALQPDWVALDGYRFSDGFQSQLDLGTSRLACIDDFGHAIHERAHAILNQNVYASSADYRFWSHQDVITGPKFALLRNEFTDPSKPDPKSNEPLRAPFRARKILITFGGADPDNMTLRVLNALTHCVVDRTSVEVILGPSYRHFESLRTILKQSRAAIRLYRNVDRMQPLMARAHLAITAGGSTCYELAHCGIPAVVIPIAQNQNAVARKLAELGAVQVLPPQHQLDDQTLRQSLSRVIRDPNSRQSMSVVGRQLIDGQGAHRLARRLASRIYNFRSVRTDDAQLLLRWRNDPEVRAVCFQNDTISLEAHRRWLNRSIQSDSTQIQIIEDPAANPVGQIRLEFEPTENLAVISINLVPSLRGRGMGTAFIERVSREATAARPGLKIIAQIKNTNLASQSSFRKAGYRSIATRTINGQVALQFAYQADPAECLEQFLFKRRAS
jgi:UDP-2,4-diacetamido-2,4,6-trideoxy-beta-L-altropyranose hydrolase